MRQKHFAAGHLILLVRRTRSVFIMENSRMSTIIIAFVLTFLMSLQKCIKSKGDFLSKKNKRLLEVSLMLLNGLIYQSNNWKGNI